MFEASAPPAPTPPPPQQLGAVSPARASEPPDLRSRVDARADAILACVGDVNVAPMIIEWGADGALSARVRGLDGSAEEACVQALLEGERLDPAPGSAGTLVHVVQVR